MYTMIIILLATVQVVQMYNVEWSDAGERIHAIDTQEHISTAESHQNMRVQTKNCEAQKGKYGVTPNTINQ